MAVDLTYTVEVQYPTPEFIGGVQTRDTIAVGITTHGHGVYIEFRIPLAIYSAQQVKDYATGYTGTIEALFDIPGVTGVSWSQRADNGELKDSLTYTVSSPSGRSRGQITLPLSGAGTAADNAKIAALLQNLTDAEGLTD